MAADSLVGGQEIDTLHGGRGNDPFWFETLAQAVDIIQDFSAAAGNNDLARSSVAGFGAGLVGGAFLSAAQFQSRADNLAQDGSDRFTFRSTDTTLWFDANGNAAGGLTLVADLQAGAVMNAGDIWLA